MNDTKNIIARVFNILHDGSIVACELKDKNLEITVQIEYLAEMIHPSFKKFYIVLNNCSNVSFLPWPKNEKEEGTPINDLKVINTELDILNAGTNANAIEIMCQVDGSTELIGGILTFTAEQILIFTEDNKQITVDELQKIAEQYWTNLKS